MGCSMFSTARALAVASIREKDPAASPATVREQLFLRFYGHELDAETRERIAARLRGTEEAAPIRRPRLVPVDWDDLEMALTWRSDEHHYYLDLRTGKVVTHPIWDSEEEGDLSEEEGDLSEEEVDEGLASGHLVEIERLPSSTEYDWMAEFAASVRRAHLHELLDVALRGRGAFRRFKDVLAAHPAERERWFAFREERMREAMREWLEAHDIEAMAAPREPTR
ncbi:MAG: hypothetical protein C5B48_00315 [Candidatus Rokuibacteriota bacterium]|nr:MAG: hypothetical protein C5B48_00315 [Candidatus Rokubacteria bacterium]